MANIENDEKLHSTLPMRSTNTKLAKMWHAENIKQNLSKLTKLSMRRTPTQSPHESLNASQNGFPGNQKSELRDKERSTFLSPRSSRLNIGLSPNSSFMVHKNQGCSQCERSHILHRKQQKQRQAIEEMHKDLLTKCNQITKQNQTLHNKLSQYEKLLRQTNQSIQPYKNNVTLMQQHLQQIKLHLPPSLTPTPSQSPLCQTSNPIHPTPQKKPLDFQLSLLLKSHERSQQTHQQKQSHLNLLITRLQSKNKELEAQIIELNHQNRVLNGIVHQSSYVVQQRELFRMASQELYQMRGEYYRERAERERLGRFVEKLRNKIYMLTSLIGYGVVSNIENNDLLDILTLKDNIAKINKIQQKLTLDVYGLQSLKSYKSCYQQIKQFSQQEDPYNCLYNSNFLTLFDDQQIRNGLEQNITTIIKPQFFLLVRAILDSKYSQFMIEGVNANRFPQFAYAFIDYFRVRREENRIQVNLKRNGDERDMMKNNFLLRVFDRKVGYLPEIATFREFLIKNTPQDQVFYYLMSRNLIYNGPELNTYLGSSDPYNFVSYEKALYRAQQLLQHLDKNCKTIIFSHLNQKKIMKNKKLLIKANYVIRLLLQIYRKTKKQKISKLRLIFDQTSRLTKCPILKYTHFKQILRKNFPNLTNSQICAHYRKSVSIFHTNGEATFFEAFSAACLEYIFLGENLAVNQGIKRKISGEREAQRCNYLMELIPDSIGQLGNQDLYQEYVGFIKLKGIDMETRLKICQFLLKVLQLRLHSLTLKQNQQKLAQPLDILNNKLIDTINQNFKKRQKYEQSLQKASSLIGKEFRKKIYEFYSEFVKDIKQQISNGNTVSPS